MGILIYGSSSPKTKLCDNNDKTQTTKLEADYEIVIYCFRACTVLQNQET